MGEGSYAKVKSAYSERLKFNVAVKIIDRKKAPTDFLEKFLPREIEILCLTMIGEVNSNPALLLVCGHL